MSGTEQLPHPKEDVAPSGSYLKHAVFSAGLLAFFAFGIRQCLEIEAERHEEPTEENPQ